MNLLQLQQFLFVAEEGTVTRGAERAAVSQPAISRALADLESSLGARLFDRGSRGVTLTEAGRVLFEYARRIFALEREAGEALADLKSLEAGRLSIGASTTIGDYLLPAAIAAFLRAHPKVELSMTVENTEMIQAGVAEGRFDIGFTEGGADAGRFKVTLLAVDRLAPFVPPDHPYAGVAVSPLVIAQAGIILRESGSGTRQVVEEAFRAEGLTPRVVCSLGSTAAIKRAVAGGLGIGIVSELALQDELSRGELSRIQVPLTLTRELHTVRLGWRRESPALRAFMGELRDRGVGLPHA